MRPIHFEIPSDNPEKAIDFYTKVFGWKFSRWGDMEYWLCTTGDDKEPGINGAIMKRINPGQPFANHISTPNIDETMKAIEAAGGQIIVPKTAIPTMGYFAYFMDLDKTIMGIMQEDPSVTI
jgi:uncharacterized protein